MLKYYGEPCPVCHEVFKEGDDIVVCPDCGTPCHRACWARAGGCVHAAEHAAGFEWQPGGGTAADGVCPNCGTHNAPGAAYCAHCGVPLTGAARTPGGPGPIYERGGPAQAPSRDEPRMAAYTAGADGGIYRREIGPDDAIDGIKARDWASYVGRSSPYYLMQFFRMSATRRKLGVSFSVLLFGPAYFFYRKMWREGFLYAGLLLLLGVPGFLLMLMQAQILPVGLLDLNVLATLANVCDIASMALTFGMCLFGVYLYKQAAGRRIREIYAHVPEGPDRADALAMNGGTNLLAGGLYLAATFLWMLWLMNLLGPYVQSMLGGMML